MYFYVRGLNIKNVALNSMYFLLLFPIKLALILILALVTFTKVTYSETKINQTKF